MTDQISGQVIGPDGTPVQGAVVQIVQQDPPPAETMVARQTTNSNGEYFFDETVVRGKGPWHVTVRYEENGQLYNDFSKPYIDADLLEETAEAFSVDLALEPTVVDRGAASIGINQSQVNLSPDISESASAGPDIPDSAVYRWDTREGSGNTLTGTISEEIITLGFDNWLSGSQYIGGSAVGFTNGNGQGQTSSSLAEIDEAKSFSIEVWAEPKSTGTDSQGALIYQQTSGSNRIAVGFDGSGNGTISGGVYNGSFTGSSSSSITLNDGLKHIVYTYDTDTNTGKIYVDTVEGSGANNPKFPAPNNDSFLVGENTGGDEWDGPIDLIQLHDSALFQSEIESLYNLHPST